MILNHRVISEADKVEVAAGEFKALQVITTIRTILNLPTGQLDSEPLGPGGVITEWWSRGIGLISMHTPAREGIPSTSAELAAIEGF